MAGPSPSPHRNAQWRSNKSPLLYSWTFHWEHVTGNNILDKHRPILTASTCLKTSDLPPGRPLSCNCQLPPAGSAPHCTRGGQTIYKFLKPSNGTIPPNREKWVFATVEGIFLFHPHPPGSHQRSPPKMPAWHIWSRSQCQPGIFLISLTMGFAQPLDNRIRRS